MLWRNGEHYPDPTSGAAFQRIAREEARNEMNEGIRFAQDNICDFVLYKRPTL